VWRLRSANCYIRVTLLYFTGIINKCAEAESETQKPHLRPSQNNRLKTGLLMATVEPENGSVLGRDADEIVWRETDAC